LARGRVGRSTCLYDGFREEVAEYRGGRKESMGFQIEPVKEFLVNPALPPALSRLSELASNLLWSWDYSIRTVFRRLDTGLWKQCGHNPVLMLARISPAKLERAAVDTRFLAAYRRACESLDEYLRHGRIEDRRKDEMTVAYFSMEYGLLESLKIYSGGLGILSGDHLKAASDAGIRLVGVGILYQTGYFQQHLNPDGWQVERYPENDFYTWPVQPARDAEGNEVQVLLEMPQGTLHVKVWVMKVGRVDLFLLDTNIAENTIPELRDITDQLYGGDIEVRIRQEIVLGVGGLRALKTLGLEPTVYHMNEGHSAFLALERIRLMMKERDLAFEEALDAARTNNVFTTHTPVPAGIDEFDPHLVYRYSQPFCEDTGVPFEKILRLGQKSPHERFSMAVLAIATSSYRNAVSRLHGEVSRAMFQDLWPNLPVQEVPITPITNGVHLPSWLNGDLAQLYDQYLQPDWRDTYIDPTVWRHVWDIPNRELWEMKRRRKRQLVEFLRTRLTQSAQMRHASSSELKRIGELFDADVLTIGFARRFATYKRGKLLFTDVERLKRIVTNERMPVQILIAGKAHPKDHPGRLVIHEIVQLIRDSGLGRHIVLVEDYDIEVGREMVQGVDLWLNNPRRGEEACGTSGIKAAINGTLNLSVLDGWFDEAYEDSGGWAIGDREPYNEEMDLLHPTAIYSLLENEILPMYYLQREDGVPAQWIQRMKLSLGNLSPAFNCQRMVREYTTRFYEPAHEAWMRLKRGHFEGAREKWAWQQKIDTAWDRVRIADAGTQLGACHLSGHPLELCASVELAGLRPEDVRVEAVVGRVNSSGLLEDLSVVVLEPDGHQGQAHLFKRQFVPHLTGRLGYTLRVTPNHTDDPLARPCLARMKWAGQ
jgi:starch phosphorylase